MTLLAVFAVLVVWHARVESVSAGTTRSTRSTSSRWRGTAGPGTRRRLASRPPRPEHHPYALDLDLFGRASLLQWLGPAATARGCRRPAGLAAHPASPAVDQPAGSPRSPSWHRRSTGASTSPPTAGWSRIRRAGLDAFLGWAESPARSRAGAAPLAGGRRADHSGDLAADPAPRGRRDRGCLVAPADHARHDPVVCDRPPGARRVQPRQLGEHAFARYAGLFVHVTAAPRELGAARGHPIAAGRTRRTGARVYAPPDAHPRPRAAPGRAAIFHFLFQALTLWDFYVFFALDAWRRDVGYRVRGWMAAVAELDALSAFAQVRRTTGLVPAGSERRGPTAPRRAPGARLSVTR